MPTVSLFLGTADTLKKSYTTADIDLTSGDWKTPDIQSFDYELTGLKEYTNPITDAEGAFCQIRIPLKGVNFIKESGATELCALPKLVPSPGKVGYAQPPTQITSTPDLYSIYYTDYMRLNSATSGGVTFDSYNQITTPTFTSPSFKFPTDIVSQHYYTAGKNFFSTKHWWLYSGSAVRERALPFWNGNPPTGQTSLSKSNARGIWTFNGADGNADAFTITGTYRDSFASAGFDIQSNANYSTMTETLSENLKQVLVAFTLPAGTIAGWYVNGKSDSENTGYFANQAIDRAFNMVGILTLRYTEGGSILQEAIINAITLDFWQPEGQVGNWGADSGIEGGEGTFTDPSDTSGSKDGSDAADRADTINRGSSGFLGGAGAYGYTLWSGVSVPTLCAELFFAGGTGSTMSKIFEAYKQSMFNPLSAIISVHQITSSFVLHDGVTANFTAAGYKFIFDGTAHGSESVAVHHVGAFDLGKYFDAFPDFAPYTTAKLYLPYIGYIDIDINLIQHGWIAVDYLCDMINGNVTAYVTCSDKNGCQYIAYTATGNCAFSVPLYSSGNAIESLGKVTQSVVSTIGMAASVPTAGASVAAADIVSAAAQGAAVGAVGGYSALSEAKQSPTISGAFGGGASRIGNLDCFLMIQRPQWINSPDYVRLCGLPSEMSGTINLNNVTLSSYSGFLKCRSIDTSGISGATDAELAEIESLLTGGIHI